MSKKETQRKPRVYWRMALYRAVGEFKNGERRMMSPDKYAEYRFRSRAAALKSSAHAYKKPWVAFVYQKGRKAKRITEI
jgi:hypothetical protein